MNSSKLLQFVGLTLGCYLGYIVYSIYQERIFKTEYRHVDGSMHKFTYPTSNVIFPTLTCFLVGSLRRQLSAEGGSKIPIKEQFLMGGFYTLLLFSINSALIYLTYPTQLILGNLRLLVIFLVAKFCSRNSNKNSTGHTSKLFIGGFITIGIFMFNYQTISKSEGVQKSNYMWGILLMVIFLLTEGFLVDTQSYIKAKYSPSSNDLLTSTNKITFLFSLIGSIFLGQLIPIISFIRDHQGFGRDMLIFCVFGAMGQFFMYQIIKKFEPYLYAITTVFRKIFMVLISIALYGHTITELQIVGMVIVFAGLIYEVRNQIVEKKEKAK